jgi:hypothetical protein
VALAPSTFGAFGGDILVGKVEIDGLGGLRFAPGDPGPGPKHAFFTAGLNHEADGLLGTLVPSPN